MLWRREEWWDLYITYTAVPPCYNACMLVEGVIAKCLSKHHPFQDWFTNHLHIADYHISKCTCCGNISVHAVLLLCYDWLGGWFSSQIDQQQRRKSFCVCSRQFSLARRENLSSGRCTNLLWSPLGRDNPSAVVVTAHSPKVCLVDGWEELRATFVLSSELSVGGSAYFYIWSPPNALDKAQQIG